MAKKTIVIALGGNALGNNIEEQKEAVAKTAKVIVDLIAQGDDLVITHGNGPQVGMIQKAMDKLSMDDPAGKQIPQTVPKGLADIDQSGQMLATAIQIPDKTDMCESEGREYEPCDSSEKQSVVEQIECPIFPALFACP